MNIVILDAYTTNPGDISWAEIEALGTVTIYDRSSRDEIPERIKDADIVISNKIVWDGELMDAAPRLKMIGMLATGYNVVDVDAATERDIDVVNVPAYSTPDVVQHTFALLLEIFSNISENAASVKRGEWVESADFTYLLKTTYEIAGRTLGIIGMGSIGRAVARVAIAFGMNVVFYNRSARPEYVNESCKQVSLEELLATADVISLHAPANKETTGMINAQTIAQMKDGVVLLNTARGNLIIEQDVADALASGKIAAYGTDVVLVEPMSADCPLRTAPNTVITPHIAWATQEARKRMVGIVADNIRACIAGSPINVVNR